MMNDEITHWEAYEKLFPASKRKFALEQALDIRKFEIGLYWQRANYFWTLIGAAFAGYALIRSEVFKSENAADDVAKSGVMLFLISCLGFVLSLAWYLVNRGSKYWQENWERHVDVLESLYVGPLYKVTVNPAEFNWWNPQAGFPYSVSKINQLVSLYLTILWGMLGFEAYGMVRAPGTQMFDTQDLAIWIARATALFSLCLLVFARPWTKKSKKRKVNFLKNPLASRWGMVTTTPTPLPDEDNAENVLS